MERWRNRRKWYIKIFVFVHIFLTSIVKNSENNKKKYKNLLLLNAFALENTNIFAFQFSGIKKGLMLGWGFGLSDWMNMLCFFWLIFAKKTSHDI